MTRRFRVSAPASSANLGPGFDALGMALSMTLEVEVDGEAGVFSIALGGEGKDSLPANSGNLVIESARKIAGDLVDKSSWKIENQIPLARGLGSSAAARAAGIASGYLLRDATLPPAEEIFRAVAEGEGHGDNAAATVFGGIRACAGPIGEPQSWPVPIAEAAEVLIVVPGVSLETSKARAALPVSHDPCDTVTNLQNLSLLLSGLASGDWDAVRRGCHDRLHEPYRLALVPGLEEALVELRRQSELAGAWLSGAGPTLAAFNPDSKAVETVSSAAIGALERHGISASAFHLSISSNGLQVEKLG